MDEMQQYLRLLRLLSKAEDALLDAGEELPGDLDPLAVEPTEEHKRRAAELLKRVIEGNCDGIAEERLAVSLGAGFFRAEPDVQVDDLLDAARKQAREQRSRERQDKSREPDETGTEEQDP